MLSTKKILICIATGLLLSLLSIAIPQSIASQEELRTVEFGFPFRFIQQDVTAVDRTTPSSVMIASPWEHPTTMDWGRFVGSWTIFSALATAASFLLREQKKK